jgi:hypothetical protein
VPSFAEMVEQTIGLLNDYTGQTPQQCSLTISIGPTDTSITVDDGNMLARGLVEIDDELVYLSGFDLAGNSGAIPAWGRGQQGTTAAAHAIGARVTTTPRPPRDRVKKTINQTIASLYPDLYVVATDEQLGTDRGEYGLPATARFVIDIQTQFVGNPIEWERSRWWRFNNAADPTDFPTGVSVTIPAIPLGQTVRTVYGSEPTLLVNPGDDFAATTGLHAGAADLVVLGAAADLVVAQEASRGQLATVEQAQRADKIQTGTSLAVARFLRQEFTLRLMAEKRRLLTKYPSRPHYEGV